MDMYADVYWCILVVEIDPVFAIGGDDDLQGA